MDTFSTSTVETPQKTREVSRSSVSSSSYTLNSMTSKKRGEKSNINIYYRLLGKPPPVENENEIIDGQPSSSSGWKERLVSFVLGESEQVCFTFFDYYFVNLANVLL